MDSSAPIPIVAIVGRPNVGKSTLFNRYAGWRRALVADSPGLTRDRIAEELEIQGRAIRLVDTAGLDAAAERGLPAAVQAQAESAVRDADAILFVVDGKAGLLPEDEAIAQTLRRTRKPLSLLVNKIDNPRHHEDRLLDFYSLGFERLKGISAEHGGGAFDALEDLVDALPQNNDDAIPTDPAIPRIALVGRPNVGKSSLMNRLLGEERVVVSDEAGTTRDAIDIQFEYEGESYVLVDTAGMRRPGRREGTGERVGALMAVRALERAQVALVVVDAEEGLTDQDAHVARLARDMGVSVVIVANKRDRLDGEQRKLALEDVQHGLRFLEDAPIVSLSALTGAGLSRLLPAIRRVTEASLRRVPTAELNRWLADAIRRHDPGMARKGNRTTPLKFLYASQVGVQPPRFVIFCTDPDSVMVSYRRYLENRLRDSFGFEGCPLRVHLRGRRTPVE
ncbi:MAG TPA: ribosome biogenesis GTPase Der [Myxococcales bacterium]|nr:ribosome biogenesis GTPase Der [Myxococcales bacterium]